MFFLLSSNFGSRYRAYFVRSCAFHCNLSIPHSGYKMHHDETQVGFLQRSVVLYSPFLFATLSLYQILSHSVFISSIRARVRVGSRVCLHLRMSLCTDDKWTETYARISFQTPSKNGHSGSIFPLFSFYSGYLFFFLLTGSTVFAS